MTNPAPAPFGHEPVLLNEAMAWLSPTADGTYCDATVGLGGHAEAILERSGDKARLVKMLEYHLRYAGSANEKLYIIKRIADLLQNHLGDYAKAVPYWEKVVKHVPGDVQAIDGVATASGAASARSPQRSNAHVSNTAIVRVTALRLRKLAKSIVR